MQSGSDRASSTKAAEAPTGAAPAAGARPGPGGGPPDGRRRSWAGLLVVALVVLAGVEVGVHALDDRLPEVLEWQSVEAQRKVAQMDALARTGGADVAIVGSSLANGDIDPATLVDAFGDLTVYNAGLSAGVPVLVEPWTTHVVLPRLRPSVLLVGLSSFDFYDHPTADEFEAAFATSAAGSRQLRELGVLERIDQAIAERSALWRHRRSLRDPSVLVDALRDEVDPLEPEFGPIDDSGRALYPDEIPEDAHAVGPPVGDWDLGERNPASLRRLIDEATAVGTTVVLVELPVTDHYVERHPGGEADQHRFLAELRALAADTGVGLVELGGLRDSGLFVDQVHLTRAAGELVTELLAARLDALLPSLRTGRPPHQLTEGARPDPVDGELAERVSLGSPSTTPGEAAPDRTSSLERLTELVRDVVEQPDGPGAPPPSDEPVAPPGGADGGIDLPPVTVPPATVPPVTVPLTDPPPTGVDEVPTTLP